MKPHLISQFLLTTAIPGIYALVLTTIMVTPNSFPKFLLPGVSFLSRPELRTANLLIAVTGICLWIWSYYHLRHHFGVLPQQRQTTVISGPYRYFKHPMYLAIFLTFTGLALTTLSVPGLLINLIILTPLNVIRGRKEFDQLPPSSPH